MECIRCFTCKNYLVDLTCQAFPDGISEEILTDKNDHSKPIKDQDNEIVFEKVD